ncbi:cold-shock protein [Clostridium butyricum]
MNIKKIVTGMMAGAAVFSLAPSNVYAENKDVEVISEAAYQQDYSRLWGQVSEFDELGRIRITNSSDVNNDVILNINEDTIIVDAATGTPVLKENIKLDENIYVYAGRAMTLSLPPITNAKVIIVNIPQDFAVPSYVKVDSVKKNDNGTTTIVTEGGNKEITFNNETNVFPYKTRNIVTVDDIKAGSKLLIWEEFNANGVQTLELPVRAKASKCMIMPMDASETTEAIRKSGWSNENSKWYYIKEDGQMQTGWLKDNNKWYYLNADGSMKTGWLLDNNEYYYLKDNGEMAQNEYIDGYYLGANGSWVK